MHRQREGGDGFKLRRNELTMEDIKIVNELEELEILSFNNELDLNLFAQGKDQNEKNSKKPLLGKRLAQTARKTTNHDQMAPHRSIVAKKKTQERSFRRQESMGSQKATPKKRGSASFHRKNSDQQILAELPPSTFYVT